MPPSVQKGGELYEPPVSASRTTERVVKQKKLNTNGYPPWVGGDGVVRKRVGATLYFTYLVLL